MSGIPDFEGLAASFRRQIEERREEIVRLSADLVAARSVNPPGDTREVAAVVAAELESRGFSPRLERLVETMPSVLTELDSGRPGPHLVINVHLDTMPPGDESAWTVPPYELTRKEGRLYGLGMGNMKGSVAAAVHALDLLRLHPEAWCGRVTLTAVSDEVVFGEHGAAHLLRALPDLVGDGLLCGEGPGFKRLSIAEKGVLWLELSATGIAGHSSSVTRLGSATARLAEVIGRIDRLNGLRTEAPEELRGLFPPDDPGFELTANVGTIAAGSFIGQVAVTGTAGIDLRVPPGMRIDEVEDVVRSLADSVAGVTVRRIKGWDPNWTSYDTPLGRAWAAAAAALGTPEQELAIRLPASDGSRWRLRGVPTLCFGPQPGFSSGVDDYAEEDEVLRCAALFAAAAVRFLDSAEKG